MPLVVRAGEQHSEMRGGKLTAVHAKAYQVAKIERMASLPFTIMQIVLSRRLPPFARYGHDTLRRSMEAILAPHRERLVGWAFAPR